MATEMKIELFEPDADLEALDELTRSLREELLELDGSVDLGNASITRYRRGGSGFALEVFADTSAVDASDEKVTHEKSRAGGTDDAS